MYYFNAKVIERLEKQIIIEVNDVGYLVNVNNPSNFSLNKKTIIYIYKTILQNSLKQDLKEQYYGFLTSEEQKLFSILITVIGIGPKTALILLQNGSKNIITKIANRDAIGLQQLDGMRPNLVNNIIDALSYKFSANKDLNDKNYSQVMQTLKTLGYNQEQINYGLQNVDKNENIENIITNAIKAIGNKYEMQQSKT